MLGQKEVRDRGVRVLSLVPTPHTRMHASIHARTNLWMHTHTRVHTHMRHTRAPHLTIKRVLLLQNVFSYTYDTHTHLINDDRPSARVEIDITQRLIGCLTEL